MHARRPLEHRAEFIRVDPRRYQTNGRDSEAHKAYTIKTPGLFTLFQNHPSSLLNTARARVSERIVRLQFSSAQANLPTYEAARYVVLELMRRCAN